MLIYSKLRTKHVITSTKHFSPDSHVSFYSRVYFDYNPQEANGVEYYTRRDVMQRNIGCRSLYLDEKGYSGKRNWIGRVAENLNKIQRVYFEVDKRAGRDRYNLLSKELRNKHQAEKIWTYERPYVQDATFSMHGQLYRGHYLSDYVMEGRVRRNAQAWLRV